MIPTPKKAGNFPAVKSACKLDPSGLVPVSRAPPLPGADFSSLAGTGNVPFATRRLALLWSVAWAEQGRLRLSVYK